MGNEGMGGSEGEEEEDDDDDNDVGGALCCHVSVVFVVVLLDDNEGNVDVPTVTNVGVLTTKMGTQIDPLDLISTGMSAGSNGRSWDTWKSRRGSLAT